MMISFVFVCVGAFFLGAIPVGYLVGRYHGVDVRSVGSGNIGATNVGRTLGKRAGAVTFVLDSLKGVAAVFLPLLVTNDPGNLDSLQPITGLLSLFGHCYSPFLNFRGGKGVATGFGMFVALSPIAAAISITTFALTVKSSGYVSVGSLAAATLYLIFIACGFPHPYSITMLTATTVAVILTFARHRENIERLRNGTESRRVRSRA